MNVLIDPHHLAHDVQAKALTLALPTCSNGPMQPMAATVDIVYALVYVLNHTKARWRWYRRQKFQWRFLRLMTGCRGELVERLAEAGVET